MIDFIAEHWLSILIVLAFAAFIVILVLKDKKQIIYKMLYALVTEAEEQYGDGTGKLKFAYVLERVYALLPSVIKVFISYKTLERWIEEALVAAKEYWAEKAGIVENG